MKQGDNNRIVFTTIPTIVMDFVDGDPSEKMKRERSIGQGLSPREKFDLETRAERIPYIIASLERGMVWSESTYTLFKRELGILTPVVVGRAER
jgi:hypothetical protein